MGLTIVLLTLVLCAVIININCESTNCINCSTSDYARIKRVKYSYPPQRFYRLPVVEPIRGLFPYTPPPNYVIDDEKQIPLFKPPRVSKTPTERMSEEDINNIVKYMSQNDLDKLIEIAEKEKYIDKYKKNERDERTRPGSDIFKADVRKIDADGFNPHFQGDWSHNYVKESTQPKIIYRKPPPNKEFISQQLNYQGIVPKINYMKDSSKIMYINYENQIPNKFSNPQDVIDSDLDINELKDYFNTVQKFNEMLTRDGHIFTDSSIIKEEELPKPTNLREEEQVISHTNHVPTIVKPDSTYEVKNFGNLPLMNYHNSKLHTVSSYNVPHYTVSTIIWLV